MGMEFYGDSYKGNDEPIFVGIPTFLKLPWVRNNDELKKIKPDMAIVGEPFDFGTTIRPGSRYGPRAIRAASTVLHLLMNTSILKQVLIHLVFSELLTMET